MTSRHLPAGQNIPSAQGGHVPMPGGFPPVDMNGGPPPGGPGHGHGPGPGMGPANRRRQPPPHPHQYAPQYHQQMNPHMYANYMPYAPQQYYGMPPQYQHQNGSMPPPGYVPYPPNYPRSPPNMHQYAPMVGVTVPPNYPRQSQHSPALATPYQPPPPPMSAPIPPQTPSSTHSSSMPPPSQTPPTMQGRESLPPAPAPMQTPASVSVADPVPQAAASPVVQSTPEPLPSPVVAKQAFRPPLPWLSRPDIPFPPRTPKLRTRRKPLTAESEAVSLPTEQHEASAEQNIISAQAVAAAASSEETAAASKTSAAQKPSTGPARGDSSAAPKDDTNIAKPTGTRNTAQPAMPLVSATQKQPLKAEVPGSPAGHDGQEVAQAKAAETSTLTETQEEAPIPPKAAPTSWANLFAKAASAGDKAAGVNGTASTVNGDDSTDATSVSNAGLFPKSNANSVAEVIRAYKVNSADKVSLIEPRGLINTGNMCYMNSVLQVLIFCVPFYNFLDQVSKKSAHSFKSETPLIDAMILFMQEFKDGKSAATVEQLRRSLKSEDLEQYGEPFTPEFVYEAIRQLPRFASMRRGHQQDAEEFLGFLLQSLDDECTRVMGHTLFGDATSALFENFTGDDESDPTGDWLEVGRKQKAAVTRSSGSNNSTPITKIFGGLLRSEFRVPGLKDSITTEPYQPLQLDIGSPEVRNVVDALRGLTRSERLQGDFNSPRGKDVVATKQVFIETLPPVLILHLKRFQFDAEGRGTVKIWKKIDYPLELEIPLEVLSRQKRQSVGDSALRKYKLISVVYHHGKNASGGHYTVDVRRQDDQDWLRLDDTVLRRVHNQDVAEAGAEEESKKEVKDSVPIGASGNRFGAMNDEETGEDDGWKQVTTASGGNKRWSSVVNGAGSTTPKGKQTKDNTKDNKVAYLLFYQRI